LGAWLLLDDDVITLVGPWRGVARAMKQQRLQPSLLFFEAVGGSSGAPQRS
jgi:hypothetical protein